MDNAWCEGDKMKWDNLTIFTTSTSIGQFFSGLIAPFYIVFVRDIGGSMENFGLAFGIMSLFSILGTYFSGRFSDKLGRKPILIIFGYLSSVFLVFYPFIQNVYQLYIIQALFGITSAVSDIVSKILLADITHHKKRGSQMGKYYSITGLFASLALMVSGFIVAKTGINSMFYAVAIMGIISTSLLLFIQEKNTGK